MKLSRPIAVSLRAVGNLVVSHVRYCVSAVTAAGIAFCSAWSLAEVSCGASALLGALQAVGDLVQGVDSQLHKRLA